MSVIDFTNARLVKLGEVAVATVEERVAPLYVDDEKSLLAAAGTFDRMPNSRCISVV
jgi:hypothetical protein